MACAGSRSRSTSIGKAASTTTQSHRLKVYRKGAAKPLPLVRALVCRAVHSPPKQMSFGLLHHDCCLPCMSLLPYNRICHGISHFAAEGTDHQLGANRLSQHYNATRDVYVDDCAM
jgi:hypothetical protein